jgi:hypothetical protein
VLKLIKNPKGDEWEWVEDDLFDNGGDSEDEGLLAGIDEEPENEHDGTEYKVAYRREYDNDNNWSNVNFDNFLFFSGFF